MTKFGRTHNWHTPFTLALRSIHSHFFVKELKASFEGHEGLLDPPSSLGKEP